MPQRFFLKHCSSYESALGWLLTLLSSAAHASFIESSMGAAVVNDATAVYFNPAALSFLKSPQAIFLGASGSSHTQFSGQVTQVASSLVQSGNAHSSLHYFLPSFYWGSPIKKNFLLGLAFISNDFNKDLEGHSILRYAQVNNKVDDLDIVPALAYRFNEWVSIGAHFNRSRAHFDLRPISGAGSVNVPDSQSRNESHGSGCGGDFGLLFKIKKRTQLGLNYRQAITYKMHGKSSFLGPPLLISPHYHFEYWTPARSMASIHHAYTQKLAFIGTVQYIQWDIFKEGEIYNLATRAGIISRAVQHYHFQNSWLLTLGTNYRFSPKWIVRAAGSYTQSPANGKFQIDTGDSLTLGGSVGYTLHKHISLDASFAHAFLQTQAIQAQSAQSLVRGENKGFVNAFALKLTVNV